MNATTSTDIVGDSSAHPRVSKQLWSPNSYSASLSSMLANESSAAALLWFICIVILANFIIFLHSSYLHQSRRFLFYRFVSWIRKKCRIKKKKKKSRQQAGEGRWRYFSYALDIVSRYFPWLASICRRKKHEDTVAAPDTQRKKVAGSWLTAQAKAEISIISGFFGAIWLMIAVVYEFQGKPTTAYRRAVMWSVFYDFFNCGICGGIIQLCDAYVFFDRLRAVSKLTTRKTVSMHIYIWGVLIFLWWPIYTLVPAFADTNNSDLRASYVQPMLIIYRWGTVVFNIYMSTEFVAVLRSIYMKASRQVRPSTNSAGEMNRFRQELNRSNNSSDVGVGAGSNPFRRSSHGSSQDSGGGGMGVPGVIRNVNPPVLPVSRIPRTASSNFDLDVINQFGVGLRGMMGISMAIQEEDDAGASSNQSEAEMMDMILGNPVPGALPLQAATGRRDSGGGGGGARSGNRERAGSTRPSRLSRQQQGGGGGGGAPGSRQLLRGARGGGGGPHYSGSSAGPSRSGYRSQRSFNSGSSDGGGGIGGMQLLGSVVPFVPPSAAFAAANHNNNTIAAIAAMAALGSSGGGGGPAPLFIGPASSGNSKEVDAATAAAAGGAGSGAGGLQGVIGTAIVNLGLRMSSGRGGIDIHDSAGPNNASAGGGGAISRTPLAEIVAVGRGSSVPNDLGGGGAPPPPTYIRREPSLLPGEGNWNKGRLNSVSGESKRTGTEDRRAFSSAGTGTGNGSAVTAESEQSNAVRALKRSIRGAFFRSIGHAFTSSLSALIALYAPAPIGCIFYNLLVPLGLHIWANVPWGIAKETKTGGENQLQMDRYTREKLARRGRLSSFVRGGAFRGGNGAAAVGVEQQQQLEGVDGVDKNGSPTPVVVPARPTVGGGGGGGPSGNGNVVPRRDNGPAPAPMVPTPPAREGGGGMRSRTTNGRGRPTSSQTAAAGAAAISTNTAAVNGGGVASSASAGAGGGGVGGQQRGMPQRRSMLHSTSRSNAPPGGGGGVSQTPPRVLAAAVAQQMASRHHQAVVQEGGEMLLDREDRGMKPAGGGESIPMFSQTTAGDMALAFVQDAVASSSVQPQEAALLSSQQSVKTPRAALVRGSKSSPKLLAGGRSPGRSIVAPVAVAAAAVAASAATAAGGGASAATAGRSATSPRNNSEVVEIIIKSAATSPRATGMSSPPRNINRPSSPGQVVPLDAALPEVVSSPNHVIAASASVGGGGRGWRAATATATPTGATATAGATVAGATSPTAATTAAANAMIPAAPLSWAATMSRLNGMSEEELDSFTDQINPALLERLAQERASHQERLMEIIQQLRSTGAGGEQIAALGLEAMQLLGARAAAAQEEGGGGANDNNGHDFNGHGNNGHDINGHDNNGHDNNGHDNNGHDINGHDNNGHDNNDLMRSAAGITRSVEVVVVRDNSNTNTTAAAAVSPAPLLAEFRRPQQHQERSPQRQEVQRRSSPQRQEVQQRSPQRQEVQHEHPQQQQRQSRLKDKNSSNSNG